MLTVTKKYFAIICIGAALLAACKKDNNNGGANNNGGGNGNIAPNITDISDYPFWGDDITITGTGFGSNVADVYVKYQAFGSYSGFYDSQSGKVIIKSVSPTSIKISGPILSSSDGYPVGPQSARLYLTVKGKSDTATEIIKFVGYPRLGATCYHYGNFSGNVYAAIGDSTVIQAGFGSYYADSAGLVSRLRLSVNGIPINYTWRNINVLCAGFAFKLDAQIFSSLHDCTVPTPTSTTQGRPGRKVNFQLSVDGHNKNYTSEVYVLNHPKMEVYGSASGSFSKSAGGNPTVSITGKHMFFTDIKWYCTTVAGDSISLGPPSITLASTSFQQFIPLSLMTANRSYSLVGLSQCGLKTSMGGVSILP